MNRSIGFELFPVVSPVAEGLQSNIENIDRLIECKLAGMSLPAQLGNVSTYPIGYDLLSTTPSAVISPHLLAFGGSSLPELSPHFGFFAPALGLVPKTPNVTPIAANLQALHDYYCRRQLLSAQKICDHGKLPNGPSVSKNKEPVNKADDTKESALTTTVYSDCDDNVLSEYQILVRQQLEFFETSKEDTRYTSQGRLKDIVPGQVGIRCKWCSHQPLQCRSPGAVYFTSTVDGLYQAAQNTVKNHLCKECRHIPPEIEQRLSKLRDGRRRGPGGKKYWAAGARARGIYECRGRLRFMKSTAVASPLNKGSV